MRIDEFVIRYFTAQIAMEGVISISMEGQINHETNVK